MKAEVYIIDDENKIDDKPFLVLPKQVDERNISVDYVFEFRYCKLKDDCFNSTKAEDK